MWTILPVYRGERARLHRKPNRMFQKSTRARNPSRWGEPPGHSRNEGLLGQAYVFQGRLREAEGLIRTGTDDMVKVFPDSPRTANLLRVRADYYEKTDRPNEAERGSCPSFADRDEAVATPTSEPSAHREALRGIRAKFKR